MSTFIWAVDISGNYSISEDIFMDFLRENDIYVGMKRNKLNIEELEKRIRQDFGIVTWTSAKIDGTRLEIQIRENEVEMSTEREGEEGKGKNAGRVWKESIWVGFGSGGRRRYCKYGDKKGGSPS